MLVLAHHGPAVASLCTRHLSSNECPKRRNRARRCAETACARRYCIIWFILGSYNVHPSNIQTGPRPWHLQFTAYRTDANDTFPFPIPPGSYADAATLTNGINLCHYNVEEGTITTAGSFDLSTERYLDDAYTLSPAQIARLAPYVHQNASSIAAQVASKYASDTYSAAHSSSQLARKTAVDLPYVVPFTSSFMSMGTSLSLTLAFRARSRSALIRFWLTHRPPAHARNVPFPPHCTPPQPIRHLQVPALQKRTAQLAPPKAPSTWCRRRCITTGCT